MTRLGLKYGNNRAQQKPCVDVDARARTAIEDGKWQIEGFFLAAYRHHYGEHTESEARSAARQFERTGHMPERACKATRSFMNSGEADEAPLHYRKPVPLAPATDERELEAA
jgi:hypothetical protein